MSDRTERQVHAGDRPRSSRPQQLRNPPSKCASQFARLLIWCIYWSIPIASVVIIYYYNDALLRYLKMVESLFSGPPSASLPDPKLVSAIKVIATFVVCIFAKYLLTKFVNSLKWFWGKQKGNEFWETPCKDKFRWKRGQSDGCNRGLFCELGLESLRLFIILVLLTLLALLVYQFQHPQEPQKSQNIVVEKIVGFPLVFRTAQGRIDEQSVGIKLQKNHKMQLREFMSLLKEISGPRSKSPIRLHVVGYASNTPFGQGSNETFGPNVSVANLRAQVVADFLRNQASREELNLSISSKEWKEYQDLQRCRPYQSPQGSPDDSTLERMNQSIMVYVGRNDNKIDECIT